MKTPEEIARSALSDPMGIIVPERYYAILVDRIAAAIREDREQTIEMIDSKITELAADPSEYHSAICWHLRCLIDSICALP